MSLRIDPNNIPIDPSTGLPMTIASFLQRTGGVIERGIFSVVGADITTPTFESSLANTTYSDYISATINATNNNIMTQWQNLNTSVTATLPFYSANAVNAFSPFAFLNRSIQSIFETEISDPNYIFYINSGLNGIVKDANDAYSQYILQTIDPPPVGFSGAWNGVTEEAYRVGLVNTAIQNYLANPSSSTQTALNTAIADYEAYAAIRNASIDNYNAAVAAYNSQVAAVNAAINTFNATYQNAALIGPIPNLESILPQYADLTTGLSPAPPVKKKK